MSNYTFPNSPQFDSLKESEKDILRKAYDNYIETRINYTPTNIVKEKIVYLNKILEFYSVLHEYNIPNFVNFRNSPNNEEYFSQELLSFLKLNDNCLEIDNIDNYDTFIKFLRKKYGYIKR